MFYLRNIFVLFLLYFSVQTIFCRNYASPKVHASPEMSMDAIEIINYWGYPAESHKVITSDHYILTLHRIPYIKHSSGAKGVVFLQHGLLCSSVDFIINLPSQSLGFILSDHGYDVWMGNVRGNVYSKAHQTLSPKDKEFWDFSFDDHSLIDLPDSLSYIFQYTNSSSIYYSGHSQGTLMGFIAFSAFPDLAKKVKFFAAMAPILYIGHILGFLRTLADNYNLYLDILSFLHYYDFLPNSQLNSGVAKIICEGFTEEICSQVIFIICGKDVGELNNSRMSIYIAHTPAGTSLKNMAHYAQMANSDNCSMYDYGKDNIKHYNQTFPPNYSVAKMEVPVGVWYGGNDYLCQLPDVTRLFNELPNLVHKKFISSYEHLDFIWGMNAATNVYMDIVDSFNTHN